MRIYVNQIIKYCLHNLNSISVDILISAVYSSMLFAIFTVFMHDVWYFSAFVGMLVLAFFAARQQITIFGVQRITIKIVAWYAVYICILSMAPEFYKIAAIRALGSENSMLVLLTVIVLASLTNYRFVPKFTSLLVGRRYTVVTDAKSRIELLSVVFAATTIFWVTKEYLTMISMTYELKNIIKWWIGFAWCLFQSLFVIIGHVYLAHFYKYKSKHQS